ncbi:MAG: hypothetical protein KDB19_02090 [Microthrixaceae bacterium]|nr:hypothetical protein [Microthrixaceae bacterium]
MNDAQGGADLLHAPLTIEYGFMRTTGPVIGAFLTGLRERRVLAITAADGRVLCPPVEYDPTTGAPLTDMVEVGTEGTVTSWTWSPSPAPNRRSSRPTPWRSSASTAPTPRCCT